MYLHVSPDAIFTRSTTSSLHCLRHYVAYLGPHLISAFANSQHLGILTGSSWSLAVQAQAVALYVTMPELTTLNGALDRLDDYQNRAKECLRWV